MIDAITFKNEVILRAFDEYRRVAKQLARLEVRRDAGLLVPAEFISRYQKYLERCELFLRMLVRSVP